MSQTTQDAGTYAAPYAELARWMHDEVFRRREQVEARMRAELETIRREAEQQESETLRAERSGFESLAKQVRTEATGRAERESAIRVLGIVGQSVDKIMRLCEQHLRTVAGSEAFAPLLEELVLETVAAGGRLRRQATAEDGMGNILVAPADAARCREILERHNIRAAVVESPLVWGGAELRAADTPYVIRNTLLSRLRKQETELRRLAAQRLTATLKEDAPE